MSASPSPETTLLRKWFPWTSAPLIVGAPMRTVSGPKLTAAVHDAGGLGFLGIGYDLPPLPSLLQSTQDLISSSSTNTNTSLPTSNSNPNPSPNISFHPFGVGVLTWNCSLELFLSLLQSTPTPPRVIWLFGCRSQSELQSWATSLKQSFPQILIFYQAGSIAEVEFAVLLPDLDLPHPSQHSTTTNNGNESTSTTIPLIDALILQGVSDSGGHGLLTGASLLTLLPEATDLIQHLKQMHQLTPSRPPIPLLAAGGLTDSRGAAAALLLGAHGIVLGTRLIATNESEAAEGFKKLILETRDGGQKTVRTRIYDEVRGTGGWPGIYGGRAIRNRTMEEWEGNGKGGGMEVEELKGKYEKAVEEGDWKWLTAFAGTGVGLIHDIRPAGDIVKEVRESSKALLSSSSTLTW